MRSAGHLESDLTVWTGQCEADVRHFHPVLVARVQIRSVLHSLEARNSSRAKKSCEEELWLRQADFIGPSRLADGYPVRISTGESATLT
jgi:hypothetical protein